MISKLVVSICFKISIQFQYVDDPIRKSQYKIISGTNKQGSLMGTDLVCVF